MADSDFQYAYIIPKRYSYVETYNILNFLNDQGFKFQEDYTINIKNLYTIRANNIDIVTLLKLKFG